MHAVVFAAFMTAASDVPAFPPRGRWWRPDVEPFVSLNIDGPAFTLFPPGHASLRVDPGRPAVIPDDPAPATVQVLLPAADAEVWFNGHKTSKVGTNRTFRTPELQPGKKYHYRIKAVWKRDGQPTADERRVEVAAGRTVVVDFTKPDGQLPPPAEDR